MKKSVRLTLLIALVAVFIFNCQEEQSKSINKIERKNFGEVKRGAKKTPEQRALYHEARELHEFYRQVNPATGKVPISEKRQEFRQAEDSKFRSSNPMARRIQTNYINRGPTNFGGRTRSIVIDRTDLSGNTILAAAVSGGVFKTINGGSNWIKVSSNDAIHNATSLAQDPRAGFENIWYYGTGEGNGNSAALDGAFYLGQGIWKSIDGGNTWRQIPNTNSEFTAYDSAFDITYKLEVHPITGDLYAALGGQIKRFNGTSWTTEIENSSVFTNRHTDVVITSNGRVYAGFSGTNDAATRGVWTSPTGNGSWTRFNEPSFKPAGRLVLALAPSNQDKLYTIFDNGKNSDCEKVAIVGAELWMWDQSTSIFTNYSSKLPDEPGCSDGNDPFTSQKGYDLEISVKPDNENFIVIGGSNAYKIENITTQSMFTRIGGYKNADNYEIYNLGTKVEHHPDIHDLVFSITNPSVLFSGTDGGVHKTTDVTRSIVGWENLNNNYQTYQYYHVAIDPLPGSDIVIGGTQDNGTKAGGTLVGTPDLTTQFGIYGGDGVAVGISRDQPCLPVFLGSQFGDFMRVCDDYISIAPEGSTSNFVTYFHLDPDNNNALYYAGKNTLYKTIDASNVTTLTWTNMGTTSVFTHADNFEIFSTTRGTYNPNSSYLLMGGDQGHIYKLNDPQNAASLSLATDITPPTATTGFPSIVTGLAIHPTNKDIVLATYSNYGTNSIFLTTNATSAQPTWTLVERNLSAHSIRSAAIAEVKGETIYFVGTARGLYSTADPVNLDWIREAPELIGQALVSSLAYRPSDNHLLIGTHGNGMYEAVLEGTLTVDDKALSVAIKLYPNPVEDSFNIRMPLGNAGKGTYAIINNLGQIVLRGKLEEKPIHVSSLQSGTYFIKLYVDDKTAVKQFIKK